MRIAYIIGSFPLPLETFILRELIGLVEHGHEVDIFAVEAPYGGAEHPRVGEYGFLKRTTYLCEHASDLGMGHPRGGPGRAFRCFARAPGVTLKKDDSEPYGLW